MKPLTKEFLLNQGKCCKNNCKNCPWRKNKNMENKYYTPNREDFREGFEYEQLHCAYSTVDFRLTSSQWIKHIFDDFTSPENYLLDEKFENKSIRVPFLTKEQIESEGWEFNEVEIVKPNLMCYKKGTMHGDEVLYQIIYILSTKWILIYVGNYIIRTTLNNNEIITNNTLFSGKCLSINEFRYICKLLNIK